MTERERVLAILHREQPDQLPWMADFDYYITGLRAKNAFPVEYQGEIGLQKMHRDYGTGFYLQGYQPVKTVQTGVTRQTEKKGDRTANTISTPVGQLREVYQYSSTSCSHGITEHLIKDIQDLKTFVWMLSHTTYAPDYALATQRYDTVGENGVVLCYTPRSPLMDLVAVYAGVETVTYMSLDEPEEFSALLDEMEEKYDQACGIVLESPAECIMIPENISSECVAPFYQGYMKRYHQKWTGRIRQAGKFSFVHQDGTVRGLIGALSKESHFDVIEAVTPLPVGEIELEEAAGLAAEDAILWGGIPGGMFCETSCSDQEFDQHVLHCIQVMTSSPRFVLGVADQVVPGSSARRIRRVRELVNQYGAYRG